MQTGSDHLKAQQAIMAAKNMYNGKLDGIWGPKSIAAKIKWERSGKFSPGIPNNGFPLNDRAPLPAGVRRALDGTLSCVEQKTAVAEPAANPFAQPVVEAASVEAPVEAPAITSGPVLPVVQMPNQNQQKHGNQNNQNRNQK